MIYEIIEPYDTDKRFPFYGFGGEPKYLENYKNECFPLNGNILDADIVGGIEPIIQEYRKRVP